MADTTEMVGKLMRIEAVVTTASKARASYESAVELTRSYNDLRDKMVALLANEDDLRSELEDSFAPLDSPEPFNMNAPETMLPLGEAAATALLRLQMLGAWIKGLIDSLTLSERMRLEAEATARERTKPLTGFRPNP